LRRWRPVDIFLFVGRRLTYLFESAGYVGSEALWVWVQSGKNTKMVLGESEECVCVLKFTKKPKVAGRRWGGVKGID